MATTLEQDLTNIASLEARLANNKVAQFAYTQNAYTQNLVDGTDVYNVNNENNIPTADASIMKVNETVLSKGYRSQASSITRMLLNHFLGRVSYNLNKANDLISSLVNTIKNNLGQANGLATLDANGRIPYSQLPETALEFKGMWNANTNTPELKDGSGERTKGDFYICNVAGTANFGTAQNPRTVTFFENDRVIYDGSLWQRLSAGDVKTVNNVSPVNGNVPLTPSDLGLGNVNNTSDADKPVSTLQQEAISQAEARAKDLTNATGKLDIEHGGTNATTTDGARTNLNINNVVNTGDSATPLENGTTKFTSGGAYAELLKKSNSYEGITIADLTPYTAYNNVPLVYLLDTIQTNFPRYGKCGIAKFVEETDYMYITFDEPNNLRLSTSGLLIIGVVGFPRTGTSGSPSNDSVVLLVTKDLAVYTCRCTRDGSTGTIRSVAVQSQSSLIFDSSPADGSSNPVTSSGIYNAIKSAVEALNVSSEGGAGKYIESISETDGKISATPQTMDTTPTLNSTKAVTSGGIKSAINSAIETAENLSNASGILDVTHGGTGTDSFDTTPTTGSNKPVTSNGIKNALDNKLPNVVNTGDSAVPEQDGNLKFTTGGAFNFFRTKLASSWLGKLFGKFYGFVWSSNAPESSGGGVTVTFTTDPVAIGDNSFICGTTSGLRMLDSPSMPTSMIPLYGKSILDVKCVNNKILVAVDDGLYIADSFLGTYAKLIDKQFTKITVFDSTVYAESVQYGGLDYLVLKVYRCSLSDNIAIGANWDLCLDFTESRTCTKLNKSSVVKNPVTGALYYALGINVPSASPYAELYLADSETDEFTLIGSRLSGTAYLNLKINIQGDVLILAQKVGNCRFIHHTAPTTTVSVTTSSSSIADMVTCDCIDFLDKFLIGCETGICVGKVTSTVLSVVSGYSDNQNEFLSFAKTNVLYRGNYAVLAIAKDLSTYKENLILVYANELNNEVISVKSFFNTIPAYPSVSYVNAKMGANGIIITAVTLQDNSQAVYRIPATEESPAYICLFKVANNSTRIINTGTWLIANPNGYKYLSGYEEAVRAGLISE